MHTGSIPKVIRFLVHADGCTRIMVLPESISAWMDQAFKCMVVREFEGGWAAWRELPLSQGFKLWDPPFRSDSVGMG